MELILKPLHLVCVADEMRPNMRLIEIKNGIAQASNGFMLVKVQLAENSMLQPEQIELLNGKYIDMEVWKECHKCDQLEITAENLIVYKNGIKKIFEYSDSQGTFFNLDGILEQLKAKRQEAKSGIMMNAKFIEVLHKVFEEPQLQFAFSEGASGICITPGEQCGMFAYLMPLNPGEAINRYFFMT